MNIVQADIDRYRSPFETESDPTRRTMITRLLAAETAKKQAEARAAAEEGLNRRAI
jgi:hypothetical protein